jgi:hypothetical protein
LTLFFGVLRMVTDGNERLYDRAVRSEEGLNSIAWTVRQEENDTSEERATPSSNELVYWSEHERSAKSFALAMAQKFPGNTYATFTINTVYSARVSEVTERKFDPQKGLLPK